MDLSGASVFIDFDGTITTVDVCWYLLERLAPASWHVIEDRYLAGRIGSRQCMVEQWALLPRDRDLIETTAREVPIDPGFAPLVVYLRSIGADVTIVSDGFGLRVHDVGAGAGIPVVTNTVNWDTFEMAFPNADPTCPCAECGTCKQAPMRAAHRSGATTVLIGDGASDAKGAEVADVVFATGHLAAWCRQARLPHHPFRDLTDLLAHIGGDGARAPA